MPAKGGTERLELRFRAQPTREPSSAPPGGWWLWCLLGISLGSLFWFAGRQQLTSRLSTQLAEAESAAEAILAVEGLLILDKDASDRIVDGFKHQDVRVAKTAYRTLEDQLKRWEAMDEDIEAVRMRALAERLAGLPATITMDNAVLVSSLASRIYSRCLELNDPQLQPIIEVCSSVIMRTSQVATAPAAEPSDTLSDTELATLSDSFTLNSRQVAFREPPPPMNITDGETSRISNSIGFDTNAGLPLLQEREAVHNSSGRGTASVHLTGARNPVHSISDGPDFDEPTLDGPEQRRGQHSAPGENAASMSDNYALSADPQSADSSDGSITPSIYTTAARAPLAVYTPASLATEPLVKMRVVSRTANLDGIQDLKTEELVRLLASSDARVTQAAALALRSQRFSDSHLELASRLAVGSAAERLQLVSQIATDGRLSPQPWLLWMAEDGEPEVRRLAVSYLAQNLDTNVERQLRILLARERDANVSSAIRTALISRK